MAAEKTSKPKPNKSEFIRSQPAEMSAVAVVEKAQAEGLAITPGLVYGVRSQGKAKRKAKKGARTKTAAVKKTAATKSAPSKAAFVRKFPGLSAQEIVAKATAEGIELGLGYVYNVRSSNKRGGAKKSVAKKTTPKTTTSRKATAKSGTRSSVITPSSAEELLKAIAAEVGLGRAIEILSGERARVRSVIGG